MAGREWNVIVVGWSENQESKKSRFQNWRNSFESWNGNLYCLNVNFVEISDSETVVGMYHIHLRNVLSFHS